ncbi:helix-turn-helix transcriptional regulator [Actinoallomurus soli]|uniref:helix-turn-helix transcriptional regulator n=1 Tax=Actinoallomurus soli TaxID=2952535 RepID=UPI002091FBEF|nr:helix-turn-helix transcriptional regulator [Actinoallomurus soli]MCO5968586.1 helix-turn-helix transcriptional regulator [Actinoallomurus soli]
MPSRDELAAFLRFRRERLTPEDVGLPAGGRRRTPGLRREEVATLAGVSTTWYTWLEQARDVTPSRQVLDALARTLQMSPAEHDYLFTLAGRPPTPTAEKADVHPTMRAFVDSLDPHPAYIANETWDVLAYNRAQAALITEYDDLPPEQRNVIWLMFNAPEMRTRIVDWAADARAMVAKFRATAAEQAGNPRLRALTDDLVENSPEFRELWGGHDVRGHAPARKRIAHPTAGLIELDYVKLECVGRPGQLLTAHLPADAASAAKLKSLVQGS